MVALQATVPPGVNESKTSSYLAFNQLRQLNSFATSYSLLVFNRSMATSQSWLPIVVNIIKEFTHCQNVSSSNPPFMSPVSTSFVWHGLFTISYVGLSTSQYRTAVQCKGVHILYARGNLEINQLVLNLLVEVVMKHFKATTQFRCKTSEKICERHEPKRVVQLIIVKFSHPSA